MFQDEFLAGSRKNAMQKAPTVFLQPSSSKAPTVFLQLNSPKAPTVVLHPNSRPSLFSYSPTHIPLHFQCAKSLFKSDSLKIFLCAYVRGMCLLGCVFTCASGVSAHSMCICGGHSLILGVFYRQLLWLVFIVTLTESTLW